MHHWILFKQLRGIILNAIKWKKKSLPFLLLIYLSFFIFFFNSFFAPVHQEFLHQGYCHLKHIFVFRSCTQANWRKSSDFSHLLSSRPRRTPPPLLHTCPNWCVENTDGDRSKQKLQSSGPAKASSGNCPYSSSHFVVPRISYQNKFGVVDNFCNWGFPSVVAPQDSSMTKWNTVVLFSRSQCRSSNVFSPICCHMPGPIVILRICRLEYFKLENSCIHHARNVINNQVEYIMRLAGPIAYPDPGGWLQTDHPVRLITQHQSLPQSQKKLDTLLFIQYTVHDCSTKNG